MRCKPPDSGRTAPRQRIEAVARQGQAPAGRLAALTRSPPEHADSPEQPATKKGHPRVRASAREWPSIRSLSRCLETVFFHPSALVTSRLAPTVINDELASESPAFGRINRLANAFSLLRACCSSAVHCWCCSLAAC